MCVSFTDISSSANIHWCKQLILIHCVAFILLFSPAFPQTAGIHWTYITMSTALCEHAECGLSCGRKLLPSFNLNNTPVKFQDCICNSCGDNICPDRHTNTWISPQNHVCGGSRNKSCLQDHILSWWHTHWHTQTHKMKIIPAGYAVVAGKDQQPGKA